MKRFLPALLALGFFPGCGNHAKPASATTVPPEIISGDEAARRFGLPAHDVEIRTFPAGPDLALTDGLNLVFLWKRVNGHANADDLGAVLQISRELEEREDRFNAIPLESAGMKSALAAGGFDTDAIAVLDQAVSDATAKLADEKSALAAYATRPEVAALLDSHAKTAAALAEAEAAHPPDPALIEKLKQDLVTEESDAHWKRYDHLTQAVASSETDVESASAARKTVSDALQAKGFAALYAQWKAKETGGEAERALIKQDFQAKIDQIGDRVGQIKTNPKLWVSFGGGGTVASMRLEEWAPPVGWPSPADGSTPILTSDSGAIQNMHYTPRGGTLDFTVVFRDAASLLETARYVFKVARARYDAVDAKAYGTAHFKGEVKLFTPEMNGADAKAFRGVACFGERVPGDDGK